MEYLEKTRLKKPILILNREGLGMKVPDPKNFHPEDVLNLVGEEFTPDVVDVFRQKSGPMRYAKLVELFNAPNRDRPFNLISMEFSNTP